MNFKIVNGNIINSGCDAIVLPANSKLKEGPGASRAIFKAAGRIRLALECKKRGECPVGCAVPTNAYDIHSKYIIHAVVPKWVDGSHEEYDYLCSAYLSALLVADNLKCKSIAFPLLSAGHNGFDLDLAFEIAVQSFSSFEGNCLEDIILVVYDASATKYVKEQGYECPVMAVDPALLDEPNNPTIEKIKQLGDTIVNALLDKAIEYMSDPQKREELFNKATEIVNEAKENIKKNKEQKDNNSQHTKETSK